MLLDTSGIEERFVDPIRQSLTFHLNLLICGWFLRADVKLNQKPNNSEDYCCANCESYEPSDKKDGEV